MRLLCSAVLFGLVSAGAMAQDFADEKAKQSYCVGVQMGKAIDAGKELLNLESMINGLMDVLEGKEIGLSQEELMAGFQAWQQGAQQKQADTMSKEGAAFLEENAKREGVIVLDNGLQYEVLREGTGKTPTQTDTIKAHYAGTLIDGTKFDSSYDRGEPFEARVTGVIRGWTEALLRMKEGDKWKLFIPYDLAYGARGAGPDIPPYSTLIFEMELLEVMD